MKRNVCRTAAIALFSLMVPVMIACGFGGDPAVRIDPEGEAAAERWQATLSSPRRLSGAVDISGTAWMAAGEDQGTTRVAVQIRNAAPGGVHPWEVHRGRCGSDAGLFGAQEHYEPLQVDDDGRAATTSSVPIRTPQQGDFFVVLYASPTNRDLAIACGNLAPPTG